MFKYFILHFLTATILSISSPQENLATKPQIKISGGIYELSETGVKFDYRNSEEEELLNIESVIPFSELVNIEISKDPTFGLEVLNLHWSDNATIRFEKMTERNLKKPLAIVLNGEIISSPIVQAKIPGGRVQVTMSDEDRSYYLKAFGLARD